MRLLDIEKCDLETGHLSLCSFDGVDIPNYAILSHRWMAEEVLFADVVQGTAAARNGYAKLKGAILQAQKDGHAYLWADTCCIDKSSSAELSESINSMWTYYREAAVCYAYLADVTSTTDEKESFMTQFLGSWMFLEDRKHLHSEISVITDIGPEYLTGDLSGASIAKRMSWASERKTQRKEDIAYCLMGLFSVNMPLLYGEGDQAFIRLQKAIMESSDDESIFAWSDVKMDPSQRHGLLADHPTQYRYAGDTKPYRHLESHLPYSMTNKGLSLEAGFMKKKSSAPEAPCFAVLHCQPSHLYDHEGEFVAIPIVKLNGANQWSRIRCNEVLSTREMLERMHMYFPQVIPSLENTLLAGYQVQVQMDQRMQARNEYVLYHLQSQVHPSQRIPTGAVMDKDRERVRQFQKRGSIDPVTIPTHRPALGLILTFQRRRDYKWLVLLIGIQGGSALAYVAREVTDAVEIKYLARAKDEFPRSLPAHVAIHRAAFARGCLPVGELQTGNLHRVMVSQLAVTDLQSSPDLRLLGIDIEDMLPSKSLAHQKAPGVPNKPTTIAKKLWWSRGDKARRGSDLPSD